MTDAKPTTLGASIVAFKRVASLTGYYILTTPIAASCS